MDRDLAELCVVETKVLKQAVLIFIGSDVVFNRLLSNDGGTGKPCFKDKGGFYESCI